MKPIYSYDLSPGVKRKAQAEGLWARVLNSTGEPNLASSLYVYVYLFKNYRTCREL